MTFHWGESEARGLRRAAPPASSSATTSSCSICSSEFKADCLGWQYQLGLIPLRPPSDFAEGLFNSACRPESNGDTIVCATEADQGNVVPMELMKRLLKKKGLHQAVMFHDVRWGADARGALPVGAAELGLVRRLRLQPRSRTRCAGVHSYRQPALYFPDAGRHVRRREPARAR